MRFVVLCFVLVSGLVCVGFLRVVDGGGLSVGFELGEYSVVGEGERDFCWFWVESRDVYLVFLLFWRRCL